MNKRIVMIMLVILLVSGSLFFISTTNNFDNTNSSPLANYTQTNTYSGNIVLTEATVIPEGKSTITNGNVTINTDQDFTVNGALGCSDGSITIISKGLLTINDTIACEDMRGGNVTIVALGGLVMNKNTKILSSGNVQIVDNLSLVKTQIELVEFFDDIETVPQLGMFIGPFIYENEITETDTNTVDQTTEPIDETEEVSVFSWPKFIHTANAQESNSTTTVDLSNSPVIISGSIALNSPERTAKRIVVFDFPNTKEVRIEHLDLKGPDGRKGTVSTRECTVTGGDGENAFRFNVYAQNLKANNFTLVLGNGGQGGDATTKENCDDAVAKGGMGGKAGNFRMIGVNSFEIAGSFIVHPGNGGSGGNATAKGKGGDRDEKGGSAQAIGGKGRDNKKKLFIDGSVAGTNYVQFVDAIAGNGGTAIAEGGKGGDASECGKTGATGGTAYAKGGEGGDAKLLLSGNITRTESANDIGGQGGITEAYGGDGGDGGACDNTEQGGDGGIGGDASTEAGSGGLGNSGKTNDGAIFGDYGGNGGIGGDGCTEGIGGIVGRGGIEDGKKGENGKNLCLSVTEEEHSLMPDELHVIQFLDYFIPIQNLSKITDSSGNECGGEEHWHPGANGAINTMGYVTPDPDPNNCGFGKTSEVPIVVIDGSKVSAEGRDGNSGEMIQIDPPALIIPSQ